MNSQTVVELFQGALTTALWLTLPLLIASFIVGIVTSLIQIITSIQDPAFSATPRLIALAAVLVLALPWMVTRAMDYTRSVLGDLAKYAN